MATQGNRFLLTAQAAADLRNCKGHVMRLTGERTCNIASHSAAATANFPIGILDNQPASNQAASVCYVGETKAVAGGAITVNVWCTNNASGRITAAASGDNVICRALTAASADGDMIDVLAVEPWPLTITA